MVDTPLPVVAAELLPESTRRLIRTVDGLAEEDYRAPSRCAGWTRGHVVAHLALNAEGLTGVLRGVAGGEPVTMYASDAQRDADIDALATAAPPELRARLLAGCTDLAEAWAALPADRTAVTFERTPGSTRIFVSGAVPVMRVREVEIHHADLDAGYTRADWPDAFAALLLEDQVQDHDPPFSAHAVDLDRTWAFGAGGPTVAGTGADLGWWLTGRDHGEGLVSDSGTLPRIGA